jgi:methionyl aminopeptidase
MMDFVRWHNCTSMAQMMCYIEMNCIVFSKFTRIFSWVVRVKFGAWRLCNRWHLLKCGGIRQTCETHYFMIVQNPSDLAGLIKIGNVVGHTIVHMAAQIRPGMTTAELDDIGQRYLTQHGAVSAPIKDYKYPAATCISINDEAAHAIASPDRVIQAGDLVNIDVSAILDGYYGDSGASFPVPPVSDEVARLCDYTKRALKAAINAVRAGEPLWVIGKAAEDVAKSGGYQIIRDLGGHGVGRKLHEPPHSIPHYYTKRARQKLKAGQVLTIEPFLTRGSGKIETMPDKWTLKTVDGKLSAQYEHTVVITEGEPILTTKVDGVTW